MKRLVCLTLSFLMMLTFVSCSAIGGRLNQTLKDGISSVSAPKIDKYIAGENEYIEIDGAMYAYLVYESLGQYYSLMVQNYGYDPTVPILNQNPKNTVEGKTFYKFFCDLAETRLSQYVALASAQLAALSEKEGHKVTVDEALTEKNRKEIDDFIKDYKDHAAENGYSSLDKYLGAAYIPGVNEAALRRYLKIEALATEYVKDYAKTIEDKFINDEEKLNEYREENPASFNKIDYVYYTFTETYAKDATAEQKTAAKARAEAAANVFKAEHTNITHFKNGIYELEKEKYGHEYEKDELVGKFVSDGVLYDATKAEAESTKAYYEWAYNKDRVAGDSCVLETTSTAETALSYSYTVYMIEKGVYYDQYNTQTVHHILFQIDEDLEGDALEKAYKKAKAKAEKVLDEYNKGEKTLYAFAKLAEKYSDDVGSAEDGGLIKNTLKYSTVEEFDAWIYDETRKEGDVELVKTEYGYHIIYYVGEGEVAWKVTADNALRNEEYQDHLETLEETYKLTYDRDAIYKALGGKN